MTRTALAAAAAVTTLCFASDFARAQRAVGIDVSSWQGSINWATVAAPKASGGGGIDFAYIRATRGRPDPTDTTPYVDSTYAYNIAQAKVNGIIPGAYHYARYDVNDALEEANDFLSVARNQMGPGYLRPVLDLEQDSSLSPSEISTWALTFSQRIFDVTGVRPIVYANSSYARDQVSGTTSLNGVTLKDHDFWLARYTYSSGQSPTQATRDYWTTQTQTIAPPTPSGFANPYGIWNGVGNSWDFWQYTDAGRTPGISGNVDQDVANGGIEFVRDTVPAAVWTNVAGGNFGSNNQWNKSALDTGTTTLFPDLNTRAIISLPAANVTVTYNGMNRTVRSLQADEAMNFLSGTLTGVQYLNFTAAVNVSGVVTGTGASGFNAPTIANAGALSMTGGTVAATGAITGSGTIALGGGVLTAKSVTQASFAVTGGTATVAGALATTGAINVSGGTLSTGSISTPAALAVTGAGRVNLTGIGGSKVAGLTATAGTSGGAVNLGLAKLAVDYTTAAPTNPAAAIRTAIGDGSIASDKAIAGVTGVGYAEATKAISDFTTGTRAWNGVTVDTTTLLLQLALFGDSDLNGTVDISDLAALATSFGNAGRWQEGDSTYDGVVNVADLGVLATNYGKSLLADGTVTGGSPTLFERDLQLFASLVPEPAALALLAPLAIALRRRRRAI